MPQFEPGSVHQATVTFVNPKSAGFDFGAILYMGEVQVASASFHLDAGQSKDVPSQVTMSSTAGTYPVYIRVTCNGVPIKIFVAEAITIAKAVPTSGNFIYSEESVELRTLEDIMASLFPGQTYVVTTMRYVVYKCKITNQSSTIGQRTINLAWELWVYGALSESGIMKTFVLTLNPNESYQFVLDPRINGWADYFVWVPYPAANKKMYFWLSDSAGGKSLVHMLA